MIIEVNIIMAVMGVCVQTTVAIQESSPLTVVGKTLKMVECILPEKVK